MVLRHEYRLYDLSDSSDPQLIYQYSTEPLRLMSVAGDDQRVAIIAIDEDNGNQYSLITLDITDVRNNQSVQAYSRNLDERYSRLLLHNSTLLMWDWIFARKTAAYEFSNAADPTPLGVIDVSGRYDINYDGDTVYLMNPQGVYAYDYSDPSDPELIGEYEPDEFGLDFSVDNGLLVILHAEFDYQARQWSSSLEFVDTSDIGNMTQISTMDLPSLGRHVSLSDGMVYATGWEWIIEELKTALFIYDATEPNTPMLVGEYPMLDHETGISHLSIEGPLAYVTTYDEIDIFDISEPKMFRPSELIHSSLTGLFLSSLETVFDGSTVCFPRFGYRSSEIVIMDFKDPTPIKNETVIELDVYASNAWTSHGYLYARTSTDSSGRHNKKLQVYDISDVANPILIGEMPSTNENFVPYKNAIYQSPWASNGLWIIDNSDPSLIQPTPYQFPLGSRTISMKIDNSKMYCLVDTPGSTFYEIQVFSLENPLTPQLLSTTKDVRRVDLLCVKDDLVYIEEELPGTSDTWVQVVDMTSPDQLTIVNAFDIPDFHPIEDAVIHNDIMYITYYNDFVTELYDVSNPLGDIQRIGRYQEDSAVRAIYPDSEDSVYFMVASSTHRFAKVDVQTDCLYCGIDFNHDRSFDFFDISMFLTMFTEMNPASDLNGDGNHTVDDIFWFLDLIQNGCD